MSFAETRRLLDLVAGKHACLERLNEHGRKQHELIEVGDIAQLLGLLAVKQRTLDELHEYERNLDPYRNEDPARRVWSSDAERLRCSSLAEQSAQLLREILAGENRCEEALRRRRDEAAVQLWTVQSAGAARGAYADSSAAPFVESTLDLTSDQ
jgi:hypothetical protein